jgi:serine/threonine protein kinase
MQSMSPEHITKARENSFIWPPAVGLTGTPDFSKWVAPEVFGYERKTQSVQPKCVFSEKSDVWSFGVTVYEVFTDGAMPYDACRRDQDYMLDMLTDRAGEQAKRLDCPRGRDGTLSDFREDVYNLLMYPCWLENPSDRPTFTQLVRDCSELYSRAIKATAKNHEVRREQRPGGDDKESQYEHADAKSTRTMARHKDEALYDMAQDDIQDDDETTVGSGDSHFDRIAQKLVEGISGETL